MNRLTHADQDAQRLARLYSQKIRQLKRAGGNPHSLLFMVLSAEAAALSDALRSCGTKS